MGRLVRLLFMFLLLVSMKGWSQPLCLEGMPLILSLDYRLGDGRSYNEGYESVEAFIPIFYEECSFPFLDVQLHRLKEGKFASNVGVGWRAFSPDLTEMVGFNLFYDYRQISHDHFHQVGAGVELLGRCWDIRANGYLPVGTNRVFIEEDIFTFPGEFVAVRDRYKRGLWGMDVEVGHSFCLCDCLQLYAAAGPYFYAASCSCDTLIGGLARMRLGWKCVELDGYITHDTFFGTKIQGEIRVTIPLGCIPCCWCSLFQRIYRNDIIILRDQCTFKTNF